MKQLACLMLALALGLSAGAGAMTRDDYKAERSRLQDQYATGKERCDALQGHPRRLCRVEARTAYDIARFDLQARFKPSPERAEKARLAQVDGKYRLAVARCGDMKGSAREACRSEAKAQHGVARNELQAMRKEGRAGGLGGSAGMGSTPGMGGSAGLGSTPGMGRQERGDDASPGELQAKSGFAAERERCRSLPRDERRGCVEEARKQFGR